MTADSENLGSPESIYDQEKQDVLDIGELAYPQGDTYVRADLARIAGIILTGRVNNFVVESLDRLRHAEE